MFKLHYNVRDCGDGSVSVSFKQHHESDDEEDELCWAEDSSGAVNLKFENGKLFFEDFRSIDGRYQNVWVEVEQIA